MAGKDIYRDTWIRYLGYANEVGESLRHIIGHRNVMLTYGISTTYCLADTVDKTMKTFQHNKHAPNRMAKSVYTAVDVLAWQLLASVIIPGFTINRICFYTHRLLISQKVVPKTRTLLVTAAGICMIPVIIHPIDHFVDFLLDNSLRKFRP